MKNVSKQTLIIIALLCSGLFASGQNADWEIIGEKVVDMDADHDEIIVTALEGKFTAIKFKVLKAPIHVKNFRIIYGNETWDNFEINEDFEKGFESDVIDLTGNERFIKKINLNYKTIRAGEGKAVVVVFGKH